MKGPGNRHDNDGLRKRCTCPRRKWPKCRHPWHFNFQWKGKHYRLCLDRHVGRPLDGKTEATAAAEALRTEIRSGRFGISLPARDVLTLEQLLGAYEKDYVAAERTRSLKNVRYQIGAICATLVELPTGDRRAFGRWCVCDVTTGALERFRIARRTQEMVKVADSDGRERARRKGGMSTTNRDLSLLRASFNWAVRLGYVDTTPFKRGTETVVKVQQELPRRRRLEENEAERLLSACDPIRFNPNTKEAMAEQPAPRLRPIVEAALETGCRRGELLSLQWWQVKGLDDARPYLELPASKTKTKRDRVVRFPVV